MSSRKKSSALESRLASIWDALGGSEPVREFRLDKTRRWRADFASESARVLIEIEGGVWRGGRHTNPQGFINDAEKYLATNRVNADDSDIRIGAPPPPAGSDSGWLQRILGGKMVALQQGEYNAGQSFHNFENYRLRVLIECGHFHILQKDVFNNVWG